MATITLYAEESNYMPGLLQNVKKAVIDYKTELVTLKTKIMNINQRVCDLEHISDCIRSSTQIQEKKANAFEVFERNNEEFTLEVEVIDGEVAEVINQRKADFYEAYSYLKPEAEKSIWEDFCEELQSVGEWCQAHWKEIVIGLVCIVVGALLTVLTGGVFLTALVAGLKAALIAAAISGLISTGISLVSSLVNGESIGTTLGKALNAFADGFASGFMFGGIMAGVSMTLSIGFRGLVKLGVSSGKYSGIGKEGVFKILSPDKLRQDGNSGGTLVKIGNKLHLDVDSGILSGGKFKNPLKITNFLHLHMPGVQGNIQPLLIVGGHIPIGIYVASIMGSICRNKWVSSRKGRRKR